MVEFVWKKIEQKGFIPALLLQIDTVKIQFSEVVYQNGIFKPVFYIPKSSYQISGYSFTSMSLVLPRSGFISLKSMGEERLGTLKFRTPEPKNFKNSKHLYALFFHFKYCQKTHSNI